MNFEEGGRRFYAMVSPEGEEHWALQHYTSIAPKDNFKYIDAFADKSENIKNEMPSSRWSLDFIENKGITTVRISIKHEKLSDLEQAIDMGFKEGFTMTLDSLSEFLSK